MRNVVAIAVGANWADTGADGDLFGRGARRGRKRNACATENEPGAETAGAQIQRSRVQNASNETSVMELERALQGVQRAMGDPR